MISILALWKIDDPTPSFDPVLTTVADESSDDD
jgi:hypothetical protein